MSLYRTWRPKSFSDLVGQDAVVRTLRTALSSGKLAHAYLFSGPRGSGKTSAAKILARCIDCAAGPTPDPDNTCENCQAMLAGTALDVVEVDAASNRGIEEIRALRESVKFAPASMRMKVFIIDEAHMLTREGANAFLKTLEEPPPHAVFILATTAPEALPATILSRCQRYAFRRIPISVMIARMREIADAEGIAIDDGALGALAYRADGGLRDALTMLEQVAAYADATAGGRVDAATVDAAFGATGRQFARALAGAVLGGDASGALRVIDEASDGGADMLGLIRGTIGEYRNLLVARIDPGLLSRDLSAGDASAAVGLAEATPQSAVTRGLRLLADALASGRSSGNPRLELETAVLRLVIVREDPSLEALAARVAALEGGAPAASALVRTGSTGAAVQLATAARALTPAESRPSAESRPAAKPALPERAEAPPETARADAGNELGRQGPAETAPARGQSSQEPAPTPPESTHTPPESAVTLASAPTPPEPPHAPPESANAAELGVAGVPSAAPDTAGARPVSLQQMRSLWEQIRLRAEERHKPLRALLSRATVDAIEGNALVIGVSDAIQEGLVRDKLAILEDAVAAVASSPLRVVVRSRTPSAPSGRAPSAPRTGALAAPPSPRTAAESRTSVPEQPRTSVPEARTDAQNGDIDLLAYARERIGKTETI